MATLKCVAALTDRQLLERCAAGQRGALDELLRRYQPQAYRKAYKLLGNDADALDAVQDALVRAFTCLGQFQGRSSFKTWLLSIVRNAALNLGRKASRPREVEEGYARIRGAEQWRTPFDELVEQELPEAIRRVLQQHVPAPMREVYMWRREGLTFKEIGQELNMSEKKAGQEMRKVIDILREQLLKLGWSLP